MQKWADEMRARGQSIGFVPTMGFLHEGHLSLMKRGREVANLLVVSIFVNPAQFGPGEDFEDYPRALEKDLALLEDLGADVVFTPKEEEVYPEGYETYVRQENLPNHLCGLSRPVFFTGVATVVAKLFHIVKPHVAVFGEKDYQQLAVIRKMVRDLNFDIEILGGPTVREPDGLAMSSRNAYLRPDQRSSALALIESLHLVRDLVKKGETDAGKLLDIAREHILAKKETLIDYVSICDPESLVDVENVSGKVLMALAVKVGKTRLIDNMILTPSKKE
jgi:pantoate--beta-alanine ligase